MQSIIKKALSLKKQLRKIFILLALVVPAFLMESSANDSLKQVEEFTTSDFIISIVGDSHDEAFIYYFMY